MKLKAKMLRLFTKKKAPEALEPAQVHLEESPGSEKVDYALDNFTPRGANGSSCGAAKEASFLTLPSYVREVAGLKLAPPTEPLPDVDAFVARLARLASTPELPRADERAAAALFDWSSECVIARAPGRLDVMGGIADYSGSLVLQMPVAEATLVAAQRQPKRSDIRIVSLGADAVGREPSFAIEVKDLFAAANGAPTPLSQLRAKLGGGGGAWAAYVLGALAVLIHERGVRLEGGGMSLIVDSNVPEAKGVSSSAAVEVASMCALIGVFGIDLPGREIALLCQRVENEVVGAPCGVMDQMASALGQPQHLMSLLCRPAQVQGSVPLPAHLSLWGIDSGVAHAVSGADYGSVRCAAFMGRALLRRSCETKFPSLLPLDYLCQLTPEALAALPPLPKTLSGADFQSAVGAPSAAEGAHAHGDAATAIDANRSYAVRACAKHPVEEHARVRRFAELLETPSSEAQLRALGKLMYASHASYSACGLGSAATDRLVQLVKQAGPSSGLYGAKITGGGSGGTVCVLGKDGTQARSALARIVATYQEDTRRAKYGAPQGHVPYVVTGSSSGALGFGHLRLNLAAHMQRKDANKNNLRLKLAAHMQTVGAATRVQALKRGQQQRKSNEESAVSAAKVQACLRGRRQRQQDAAEARAAMTMQAGVRGRSARQQLEQEAKQGGAVTVVQARVRGQQSRKEARMARKMKHKQSSPVPLGYIVG